MNVFGRVSRRSNGKGLLPLAMKEVLKFSTGIVAIIGHTKENAAGLFKLSGLKRQRRKVIKGREAFWGHGKVSSEAGTIYVRWAKSFITRKGGSNIVIL